MEIESLSGKRMERRWNGEEKGRGERREKTEKVEDKGQKRREKMEMR